MPRPNQRCLWQPAFAYCTNNIVVELQVLVWQRFFPKRSIFIVTGTGLGGS